MKIKTYLLILLFIFSLSKAFAATDDFSKVANASQSFKADDFLGAGSTSIPIAMPQGRKNMQPEINIQYSSASGNGWLGLGWALNFGYIERSTKNGIPKYDPNDIFYISFGGLNTELVRYAQTNEYYPKVTPVIIKFLFKGTYWEAYDKDGRKYVFGQTSDSRIDLPKGTFRWALNKVVDTCGNYMTFTYARDGYQIYPLKIEYAGNETTYDLPTNRVDFILEDRQDFISSYRSGYNITTAKRLREIKTYVSNSLAARYLFEYAYSNRTKRSLLNKFTQFGNDGISNLPPALFSYQDNSPNDYRFITVEDNTSNKLWGIQRNFGPLSINSPDEIVTPKGTAPSGIHNVMWDIFIYKDKVGSFWSIDDRGSLSVNLPDAGAFHAWTYIYVNAAKAISIPSYGNEKFFFWLNGDYSIPVNPQNINLKEGPNLLEVTGYSRNGFCTFNLNYALSDNVTRVNNYQFAIPQLVGDFNGDGMSDLGTYYASNGYTKITISKGETFNATEVWTMAPGYTFPKYQSADNMLLGDFNGDTLTDIMAVDSNTALELAASRGDHFTDEGGGGSGFFYPNKGKVFAADFNNDGKSDIGLQVQNTNDILIASSNNGLGFSAPAYWLYNFPGKILIGDFNGDGLIDIGSFDSSQAKVSVAINKGDGFSAPSSWLTSLNVSEVTTADLNNDGLTDIAYYDKVNGQIMAAYSDGSKFLSPVVFLSGFSLKNTDVILQIADFNGDCTPDFYIFNATTLKSEMCYSKPNFTDSLIKVENGVGGITSIKYDISSNYVNSGLPFSLPVVKEVTISDGIGNSFASTYSFKDGLYDKTDREFRGFGYVSVTDGGGNKKVVYTKQDSIFKGRPYREEHRDKADNLYLKIENTWGSQAMKDYIMGAGNLVVLKKQEKFTYDGDATYKSSYKSYDYSYAYNGQYGPMQVGGDITGTSEGGTSTQERKADIRYVWSDGDSILTRASFVFEYVLWQAGPGGLHKDQLYYDNNTALDAKPTKGLLTKEKVYTLADNGVSPETADTNALITNYIYDLYGNMVSKTDPENHATTVTYDSVYHMFPVEERNALGHVTKKTYDPNAGQVLTSTDENNQVTTYIYDVFGRLSRIIGPNDTYQYPGVIYEYNLNSCPSSVIKSIKTANPSTYASQISFYNGLSRLIETKIDAEKDPLSGGPRQIVKDAVVFNAQGKVKEKYNPFIMAGSIPGYVFPDSSVGKTSFEYDCLGRTTRITNPDSTYKTVQYLDWIQTKIDENGHQVRSTYDAFNRLVRQDEFNQGQVYTTTYTYDLYSGETIDYTTWRYYKGFKIVDSKNNATLILYDTAGRKFRMTDPDMGIWYYSYDKAGNLKTQKDAKSQLVGFNYDSINRLTGKVYPDGKAIIYYYDDAGKSYCKGRLSYINDLSGRKDFYYDNLGRQIKVSRTIDGVVYPIERTYNYADQVTSVKYPDGEIVNYTYNNANLMDKIVGSSTYVNNVDYAPGGQMVKVSYGNGTYTDYVYDPQNLRLTSLRTNNGSLQDLNYRYDNVGNIASTTDYRNSATQGFVYDDLNRLISATGAYGSLSYQYDQIGNMIYKEGASYTYGSAKPHAVTSGTDGFAATYDANGSMITKNGINLTYDYDNKLVKYEEPAGNNTVTVDTALTQGWNFVALPLALDNYSVASVLSSIAGQYDQVSRYNPSLLKFEHFVNDANYNQFAAFEAGKGYQIYVTNPSGCTLRVTGRISSSPISVSLSNGWQMIGYPSKTRIKVSDALAGLVKGTNYDRISRYNKATNTFTDLALTDYLEVGQAYFIHMLKASTWVIPASITTNVTTFAYDADGNRVKKALNGTTTVYIDELYEKTGSLTTKHIYLYEGTVPVRICSKGLSPEGGLSLSYYHSDHLGSSNVVTNASGQQVQLSEYKPFGELSRNEGQSPQGTVPNKYLFTGKELDNTGLYYYGARYYDAKIGRFITADPIDYSDEGIKFAGGKDLKTFLKNPQNLNRYSYCLNNPVRYIDPDGFYTLIIPGIGFNDIGFSGDLGKSLISAGESVKEVYWSGNLFSLSAFNQIKNEIIQASEIAQSRGEELNIIAQSWGGVLSGYALRETGVKANWVTLGTPYFNFNRPKGVVRYANFMAEGDIVAVTSIFNFSAFQIGVFNVDPNDENTDASYFDIHNYWNNPEVINLILQMLGLNQEN